MIKLADISLNYYSFGYSAKLIKNENSNFKEISLEQVSNISLHARFQSSDGAEVSPPRQWSHSRRTGLKQGHRDYCKKVSHDRVVPLASGWNGL